MIIIDYKDTRPIYEQVVDKFIDLILKGVLLPDEQMPSVRNLAMDISINPNTIQKAYMELERQGYIYAVKGRGNFVSNPEKLLDERKQKQINEIIELSQKAIGYGVTKEDILEAINKM